MVAPIQEASAIGHALTLRRPLRIDTIAPNVYAIDGTPTDCVNIAITHVLKGKPDLIVSGINKGWNLGDDVTYSGTVSGRARGGAARHPEHRGLVTAREGQCDFTQGGVAAGQVAEAVLLRGMPRFTFLNVNVPLVPSKGFKATVQAKRNHVTVVSERMDPRHRPYYWIEEGENHWEFQDHSDYQAVSDGYVSITPLQPDMTAHDAFEYLEGLSLTSRQQPLAGRRQRSGRSSGRPSALLRGASSRTRPARRPCRAARPAPAASRLVEIEAARVLGADRGVRQQPFERLPLAGRAGRRRRRCESAARTRGRSRCSDTRKSAYGGRYSDGACGATRGAAAVAGCLTGGCSYT